MVNEEIYKTLNENEYFLVCLRDPMLFQSIKRKAEDKQLTLSDTIRETLRSVL